MTISPVTNNGRATADLLRVLSMESMPTRDRVIKLDLEPVGLDLTEVPLDEVLQFRDEHKEAHRAYRRTCELLWRSLRISVIPLIGKRCY